MKAARRRPTALRVPSVATASLAAPAAALFVGACVAVVPIVIDGGDSEVNGNYSKDVVSRIIASGPIPTEVHGNSSELDTSVFHSLVVARLQLPAVWGQHSFSTAPEVDPDHRYRLVLVFNPVLDGANSPAEQPNAPADSADRRELALCRGDIETSEGPYPRLPIKRLEAFRDRKVSPVSPQFFQERVLIQGALCLGDVPITTSFVERQRFDDYTQPEFTHMLAQLLLRLMPYRDPPRT